MQELGEEAGGAAGSGNLCARRVGFALWGDDKEEEEEGTDGPVGLQTESTPD